MPPDVVDLRPLHRLPRRLVLSAAASFAVGAQPCGAMSSQPPMLRRPPLGLLNADVVVRSVSWLPTSCSCRGHPREGRRSTSTRPDPKLRSGLCIDAICVDASRRSAHFYGSNLQSRRQQARRTDQAEELSPPASNAPAEAGSLWLSAATPLCEHPLRAPTPICTPRRLLRSCPRFSAEVDGKVPPPCGGTRSTA